MVEIVQYRPSWPAEFQEIASVLRDGLGRLAFLPVTQLHVGRG